MKLSQRLILSYIIIIIVTLALAFITLVVTARPLQNRLNEQRFEIVARELTTLDAQSADKITAQVSKIARAKRLRLLLLDNQNEILLDTQGLLGGERFARFGQPIPIDQEPSGVFDLGPGPGNDPPLRYILVKSLTSAEKTPLYIVAISPDFPMMFRFVAESGWGFIIAGMVATLVSLIFGVFMARSIARPLQEIAQVTQAVAAGNYQQRLREEVSPPEIKQLAQSFNVMMREVEANQLAMRDFVSNVSHELKTPLTSIKGFSQAIAEGATPDAAAQQRAATIIHQEAHRLTRLVEDLLDLAKLDSGQVVIRQEYLDLAPILSHSLQRLAPQAKQKRLKLLYDDRSPVPAIVGDGDRLAQVFTNLLDNAIRHTPAEGSITIVVQKQSALKMLEVSITDTGEGISAEELPRVFERFYQVEKSRKRGHGTGLGLAIIKEIIEAHGGTIHAESVMGLGSRFVVRLPLNPNPVTKPRLLPLITPTP